jgi:hypothetical protein
MRVRRYSRRSIASYLYWIKYFIVFNGKQHPSALKNDDIARFSTYLAVERNVAASTQAIAPNAIVFLKTKVPGEQVGDLSRLSRSSRQAKLPVVSLGKRSPLCLSKCQVLPS